MTIGKSVVELAAELAVGSITAEAIKSHYGDSILTDVLAIGGGIAMGAVASKLIEVVDYNTGIVSGAGDLVDDFISIFE